MGNLLPQSDDRQVQSTPKVSRKRWRIVWVLFLSTLINYISRQTFSVLSPLLSAQLHFNHAAIARIMGAFQISYALTWLVGGVFLDIVGTRIGLALAVIWWSAVNILTVFASSVSGFVASRFMLGIGEGLNWPGATKAVAEWFPAEERGLAVAIFDSGSSVGGAIAALAIPWIALSFGWHSAFAFSGLLGFLWLVIWLRTYPSTRKSRTLMPERTSATGLSERPIPKNEGNLLQRWRALARDRNLWGIVLGRALTDPIWWFYVFWLPQYLSDARGFGLKKIALFAWIPFVAADLGNFTGGWISGYCIRRGISVIQARRWVCAVSCLPILAGIPAAHVHSVYLALTLICVALWGYASWSTMGLTLPSDLFPQNAVATVTGLSGFVAGIVGAGFTFAVGVSVDRFSYGPAFLAAGLLPVIATVCVFVFIRPNGIPSQRNIDHNL